MIDYDLYSISSVKSEPLEESRFLFDYNYYSNNELNIINYKTNILITKYQIWKHFNDHKYSKNNNLSYKFNNPTQQVIDHISYVKNLYVSSISSDFDVFYYLENNQDVKLEYIKKKNQSYVWYHFINYGSYEVRKFRFIENPQIDLKYLNKISNDIQDQEQRIQCIENNIENTTENNNNHTCQCTNCNQNSSHCCSIFSEHMLKELISKKLQKEILKLKNEIDQNLNDSLPCILNQLLNDQSQNVEYQKQYLSVISDIDQIIDQKIVKIVNNYLSSNLESMVTDIINIRSGNLNRTNLKQQTDQNIAKTDSGVFYANLDTIVIKGKYLSGNYHCLIDRLFMVIEGEIEVANVNSTDGTITIEFISSEHFPIDQSTFTGQLYIMDEKRTKYHGILCYSKNNICYKLDDDVLNLTGNVSIFINMEYKIK